MRPRLLKLLLAAVLVASSAPLEAAAVAPARRAATVERLLARMTLEEKVAQMFMVHVFGTSLSDPDPDMVANNQALYGVDDFRGVIEKYRPGGIIYFAFSNNVDSPHQIAQLSNDIQTTARASGAGVPMLVATDQEQGLVARAGEPFTQFPGNMAIAAGRRVADARAAARITGRELLAVGVNDNFAPVADVNVNPANPVIGVRSFGERPGVVARMAAAQVRGFRDGGLSSTAKHFPGHGDTDVDSHTGLPVVDRSRAELEASDLAPFRAAIKAGVDAIMTAHIVVPALDPSGRPATLSKPILTGLLRREMGFDGAIVTDALTMEGVRTMFDDERVPVEAIKAGADLMLMPPDFDAAMRGVLDAVADGEIKEARIDRSVRRILSLKHRRGILKDPFVDLDDIETVVGRPRHLATADAIARRSITLLEDDGTLPLRANGGTRALVTGWGPTTLQSLGLALELRGVATEVLETGAQPDASAIELALAAAQDDDYVIVTTNRAWANTTQADLVNALLATGTPVVVLAVRDPYDIAHFPEAPVYLATYGFRPGSMTAAARVLFGEMTAGGRLPVTIPGADGGALYRYGAG